MFGREYPYVVVHPDAAAMHVEDGRVGGNDQDVHRVQAELSAESVELTTLELARIFHQKDQKRPPCLA